MISYKTTDYDTTYNKTDTIYDSITKATSLKNYNFSSLGLRDDGVRFVVGLSLLMVLL